MKILDRYILRELLSPFIFGVMIFSIVLMAGMVLPKVMVLLTKGHIGLLNTLLYCLYMFPGFLVLTLAMSTLLGVLLGFGRLSSESEAVAMHAAGVSLPRLALPAIAFGLVISLCSLVLGEYVVPYANHQAQVIITKGKGKSLDKQKNVLFLEKGKAGVQRTISAALYDTATGDMEQVIITESHNWRPVGMITARRAERKNNSNTWDLYDGTIYTLEQGLPASSHQFQKFHITFSELGGDLTDQFKKLPAEMTYRELQTQIADLQQQQEDPIAFQIELPRRISIPFVCLVFTLIGTPLGMRSHRRSTSPGMALTLLVVFFYYVLFYALGYAAWYHTLSPDLAAWLPNIVCSGVGLVLIFTARK
jgi:lipopolysaccharide export system permease protein